MVCQVIRQSHTRVFLIKAIMGLYHRLYHGCFRVFFTSVLQLILSLPHFTGLGSGVPPSGCH